MTVVATFRLVVSTDKYAGNFERDITAAATGVIGDCEVGDDQLEEFFEAAAAMGYEVGEDDFTRTSPFEMLMESRPDDHGCHRPCAMAQNADREYHDVEMYMYQRPSNGDLAFMAQRIRSYAEQHKIVVLSIKLVKTYTTTVDEVLTAL